MTQQMTPGTPAPAAPPGPALNAQPRQTTSGLAVASLVLGILWIYGIGSILARVFGYVGKRQIDDSNGAKGGRGIAIAGIVLGWIGTAGVALLVIASITIFAVGGSTSDAQKRACRAERSTVEAATEAYRAQTGAYPQSTSDLVGTYLRSTPRNYSVSGATITAMGDCR
jgi:hypothetical protein